MTDQGKPGDTGRFKMLSEEVAGEMKNVLSAFTNELKHELREDQRGFEKLMREHTATNLAAHEATRRQVEGTNRQVTHLTTMTHTLWRDVRGNQPPPSPPTLGDDVTFDQAIKRALPPIPRPQRTILDGDLAAKVEKTAGQVSNHDGDIADLHGQVLAIRTEQQEQSQQNKTIIGQNAELLKLQNQQMGKKDPGDARTAIRKLIDSIVWAIRERDGQRHVMTLLAGLTGLLWITSYLYAVITGHPPPAFHPPQFGSEHAGP